MSISDYSPESLDELFEIVDLYFDNELDMATRKSALNLQDQSSFAYDLEATPNGRMLMICGQKYEAWSYDTYIYDALNISGYWNPEERTYKRIMHLRNWLRENVQHGHDLPINVRSLHGAKKLIDKIIGWEYPDDDYWQEQRKFQLEQNAKIMLSQ